MSDSNSRICLSRFDYDDGISTGMNQIEMLSYVISIHSHLRHSHQKRNVYNNQSSNSSQSRLKGQNHPKDQSTRQGRPN